MNSSSLSLFAPAFPQRLFNQRDSFFAIIGPTSAESSKKMSFRLSSSPATTHLTSNSSTKDSCHSKLPCNPLSARSIIRICHQRVPHQRQGAQSHYSKTAVLPAIVAFVIFSDCVCNDGAKTSLEQVLVSVGVCALLRTINRIELPRTILDKSLCSVAAVQAIPVLREGHENTHPIEQAKFVSAPVRSWFVELFTLSRIKVKQKPLQCS